MNREMDWKKLLGSVPDSVDQELRLRNEYLLAENRILRQQVRGRLLLTDSDRKALAAIGQQLGRKALAEIATVAQADTILAWNRTFAAQKCDGAKPSPSVGRPRINQEMEDLVVRMAQENRSWGYDRIVGALANLGYTISDQTVGNILKRHGIPPAPERKRAVTWREFIRFHMAVLLATDFFTSEMWGWFALTISSLLCLIHCARQHIHSMGRLLYQRTQKMGACVLHALNVHTHIQRSGCWMKTCPRSWAIRWSEGLPWNMLSAFTPDVERQPRSPGKSKIAFLSAVHPSQIRDGPMQHQQQLNRICQDNLRKAA
jgi:transposase